MKMVIINKSLLFVFIILIICGCATAPNPNRVAQRNSAIFQAPKDKVWSLLVAEIAQKYPVQVVEKDSGLITTQFVQMPVGFNNSKIENYIFPPSRFLATWEGLRMNMQIIVSETNPAVTTVAINAHYEAFESNVSKSWIVATSNGSVENGILTTVELKLGLKK